MAKDLAPQIVSDVLYGINIRPQEIELFKEYAQFTLRYSPIFDNPEDMATVHYKLLVIEITCQLPPDLEVGRNKAENLELLRCGWQLEMHTAHECRVDEVPELPDEMPHLMQRVSELVNRLAEDAQIDAVLPPETIERLVEQYQQRHPSPN